MFDDTEEREVIFEEISRRNDFIDKELSKLEEEYKDHNLVFYNRNGGFYPVQFYGEYDGLKFYWRTRSNCTRIILGPYSPETDKKENEKIRKIQKEKYLEHKKEDDCENEEDCFRCMYYLKEMWKEDNPPNQYYPHLVVKSAEINNLVDGDDFKGDLDSKEIIPVFTELINNLQVVSKEE